MLTWLLLVMLELIWEDVKAAVLAMGD